jgi:hypothetical protein
MSQSADTGAYIEGKHTALSEDDDGQDYRPVEAMEQRRYWQRQDASGQHGPNSCVRELGEGILRAFLLAQRFPILLR